MSRIATITAVSVLLAGCGSESAELAAPDLSIYRGFETIGLVCAAEGAVVGVCEMETRLDEEAAFHDFGEPVALSSGGVPPRSTASVMGGLLPGQPELLEIWFRARIVTEEGRSPWTEILYLRGPRPATDVSASVLSDGTGVHLRWTRQSEVADAIRVDRRRQDDPLGAPVSFALRADATEFVDETIEPGEDYWYEIVYLAEDRESVVPDSASVSVTVPPAGG